MKKARAIQEFLIPFPFLTRILSLCSIIVDMMIDTISISKDIELQASPFLINFSFE